MRVLIVSIEILSYAVTQIDLDRILISSLSSDDHASLLLGFEGGMMLLVKFCISIATFWKLFWIVDRIDIRKTTKENKYKMFMEGGFQEFNDGLISYSPGLPDEKPPQNSGFDALKEV